MNRTTLFLLLGGLLILGLVVYYYVSHSTPEHYEFGRQTKNGTSPFKIAIIAGTHGNEPAGTNALEKLLDSGYFDRLFQQGRQPNISIRVIPRVNAIGLKLGVRHQPNPLYPDINRNYLYNPTTGEEDGLEPVSKAITDLTKDCDLVIDLHEGWGFHLRNPESIGSTLSHSGSPNSLAGQLSKIAVESLNSKIPFASKKFVVLDPKSHPSCDIRSTLRCARHLAGKNYILIETTGQNDIQPMDVRVGQHIHLIDSILRALSQKTK